MTPIGWRWWLWIFQNDDDPYGIFPHTKWGAFRQGLRNPLHNLMWHVWNKEGGWFFEIPKDGRYKQGWWFYMGHRPWTTPPGAFGIKLTNEMDAK